jgi:D-amino peptidase
MAAGAGAVPRLRHLASQLSDVGFSGRAYHHSSSDQQNAGPKIYISVDIEGVGGVVNEQQLGPDGFEYEQARRWMTSEAVAAAEACLAAGARQVVISDSHGNGCNILPDALPRGCRLVRSWPREHSMMAGIDSSFAGVMLVGYHTGTHLDRGVRAHTMSSQLLTGVKLNGKLASEADISAATAADMGVPIIMASGDDALCTSIAATLGTQVETACTKTALSFHSADCLLPTEAAEEVGAAASRAMSRLLAGGEFAAQAPLVPPIALDVSMKNYRPIEMLYESLAPSFPSCTAAAHHTHAAACCSK